MYGDAALVLYRRAAGKKCPMAAGGMPLIGVPVPSFPDGRGRLRWEVIAAQLFIGITSNSRTFSRGLFNFSGLLKMLTSTNQAF